MLFLFVSCQKWSCCSYALAYNCLVPVGYWHYQQECKRWRPFYFQHGHISRDYDQGNVTEEHTHTTSPRSRKYFCTSLTWPVTGCWGRGRLKVCRESVITNLLFLTLYNCRHNWKFSCLFGWWSEGHETWVFSDWKSDLHVSAFMLLQNESPSSACRSARNFGKNDFTKVMAVVFLIIYNFI